MVEQVIAAAFQIFAGTGAAGGRGRRGAPDRPRRPRGARGRGLVPPARLGGAGGAAPAWPARVRDFEPRRLAERVIARYRAIA
ncbi:MAG: hypothetical protein AVDCRST_MAG88-774 [uncultured Thermomicrobiales bacterium]|uniref:Uncharacterized protein n=1 Tax=uncultured Thermomicrobiales bacterium TaxID=1645740 RepID=A0A6J4UHI0_9BACT|nr:MAG: hypothetical protein AVDCRST_MAG88-774 [uncultured Thermomicrobiales bacterium]